MTTLAATIATKAAAALAALEDAKGIAAHLAANPATGAADWGKFATDLAQFEGRATLWARLQHVADAKGEALEQADIQRHLVSVLSQDVGDTYSGRGNDVVRARFDGVRAAAQDALWI